MAGVTQQSVRPKSDRMLLVEARLGRTVEDILREVLEAGGDQAAAAERLSVERSTVSRWARELGIDWKQQRAVA